MPHFNIQKLLQQESTGGVALFFATILAMIWANSPYSSFHQQFIDQSLFIINDGLMSLFFLFVGLELRRSYRDGDLSSFREAGLPLIAALGGMIVPAAIYYAVNFSNPDLLVGWATPVATDIAFVMGVLSLFGERVPLSIKLFLLSLAIFDDIGAILIVAFFYTIDISFLYLMISILIFLLLLWLRRFKNSLWIFIFFGLLFWVSLWKSSIHPAISGVFLAFAIPASHQDALENYLHPWVVFIIMPLFALANAGFSFTTIGMDSLLSGIVIGITLGLFIGKQTGIFLFCWVLIKLRFAKLPAHASWRQLYGAAVLCGIGFTMSLFLGALSFFTTSHLAEVRVGVLLGSLLSGVLGAMCFKRYA